MSSKLTRVSALQNPNYQRSGIKSYVSLLKKYNFTPTLDGPYFVANLVHQTGLASNALHLASKIGGRTRVQPHMLKKKKKGTSGSTSATDTGEVTAEDVQNDSQYICEVAIGTPAQNLMLDFDTGSSDLWVWSTELSSTIQTQGKAAGHTIFDPTKSSTWKVLSGETWSISYGDSSSASGDVGTDNVTIGGLTIKAQAVEVAKTISSQFVSSVGDGLLGLAWPNINTVTPTPVATPVANMITQADIPSSMELFTAHLGNYRDGTTAEGQSFYTFGYVDQTVLSAAGVTTSSIPYTPIDNSQGFWQFASASYSINGQTHARSGNTAIADTGTTLALVDDAVCKAIYAAIPGSSYDSSQQGYVFPSTTHASALPSIAFAVGNKLFAVQKDDLAFADAGNGMVYGGIQSRGDMTFDILGDTFLKSIYAIFDQGNMRFGAVQRTDTTDPATASSQATRRFA